jgi:hypothetical protein
MTQIHDEKLIYSLNQNVQKQPRDQVSGKIVELFNPNSNDMTTDDLYFVTGELDKCSYKFLEKKYNACDLRISKNNNEEKNLQKQMQVLDAEESKIKTSMEKLKLDIKDKRKILEPLLEMLESTSVKLIQITAEISELETFASAPIHYMSIQELSKVYETLYGISPKENMTHSELEISITECIEQKLSDAKILHKSIAKDFADKKSTYAKKSTEIDKRSKDLESFEQKLLATNAQLKSCKAEQDHIQNDKEKQTALKEKIRTQIRINNSTGIIISD